AQHQQANITAFGSLRRGEDERIMLLRTLGGLYVMGIPIEWKQFFSGSERCVSLPSYPWQHTRCWFEEDDQACTSSTRIRTRRDGEQAHPLLQQYMRLAAPTQTHCWEASLSTRTFPYLQDHQVQKRVVFPAAAYIEMAYAAAQEALGIGTLSIEQVRFEKALFLSEKQPQRLQITLEGRDGDRATFSFFTFEAQGDNAPEAAVRHAQGTVCLRPKAACNDRHYNLEELRQRCSQFLTKEQHYQDMEQHGLFYGPAFQGVEQLWKGQDEVLAFIRTTPETQEGKQRYITHPAFLDACIQTWLQTIPSAGDTYLPITIETMTFLQPLEDECWVYVQLRSGPEEHAGILAVDFFLLNAQGDVLAHVEGMRFQRIEAAEDTCDIRDWFYAIEWEPLPAKSIAVTLSPPLPEQDWLIFADVGDVATRLVAVLEKCGQRCTLVYPGKDYQRLASGGYVLPATVPEAFERLLADLLQKPSSWRGIVHCWSLDTLPSDALTEASIHQTLEQTCVSVLHLVQALMHQDEGVMPHLFLVTRGAQAVGKSDLPLSSLQASLWGMGRVIFQEHPELHCTLIDLSSEVEAFDIVMFASEILTPDLQEGQVALRGQQRYVARLVPHQPKSASPEQADQALQVVGPDHPFHLVVPHLGLLETIHTQECERVAPGPGEIEIQVYAAGLNFRDVMVAIGINVGQAADTIPIGGEHVGYVVRVGEGVTNVQVGDAVMAIAQNGISSYVTLPADHMIVQKPDELSFEEAATLPFTFFTAYYALYQLGHLTAGERILIHSATGGVGQAAIQLAQLVGAKIFATAGSEEKRTQLRAQGIQHVMDSRSLTFADEVLAATNGRGVDVILNSLSGEAQKRSLEILAPCGRFLEIGKRDIYQDTPIGLRSLANNSAFYAVAADKFLVEHPSVAQRILEEIIHLYTEGKIKPLPRTVFSIDKSAQAFRYMAQGRHSGKIVLSLHEPQIQIEPLPRPTALFHTDATYLLTGGLGGIGLELADWMVEHGAHHLVLVGRSMPSEAATYRIAVLQQRGANVITLQADITSEEDIASILHHIEQAMPPLRGIMHAAAILDDGTLLQLDQSRMLAVMAPKVLGAWHLHRQTRTLSLDFFVCFSSVAGLLGSPGQGNYCAANTFLDTFMHERRAQGLPALSINWGVWAQVGLAAAQANRGKRIAFRGLKSFSPKEGFQALEILLTQQQPQLAFMPFDFQQWQQFYPQAAQIALFSHLAAQGADGSHLVGRTDILEHIMTMPVEKRLPAIESYMEERLA
ncbi:MAG: SDR family NAD(P)-dependent oxidoreductase, partial [Chloroflexi bacterium]|nr:SDR family NAD(P)-dependent oxidoreductase [Chloroflexota bacterium]